MALIGQEIPNNTIRHTQVYDATHNRADQRLPYMNRSFISFSYGGKLIEDFNLIAVIDGDRLNHSIYAPFADNITDSNIFDGQIYWSSHFKANAWDLTLATDGITDIQLDEFKRWFRPGPPKELVLAEHPNRGIMARISTVPNYSMIPFGETKKVKVNEVEYETKTTLYKGTITLSFVMDDPFWYSLNNILVTENPDNSIAPAWVDANNVVVSPIESKDALKIILEDNVPTVEMIDSTQEMLFGTTTIMTAIDGVEEYGSLIEYSQVDIGHIAYAFSTEAGDIEVGDDEDPGYFFYGGSAPCSPIIRFTLTPQINDGYIVSPCNTYGATESADGRYYNTITFESQNKYTFKFTTPGIYTGYNQAVNVIKNKDSSKTWEDIKVLLRDNVKHYVPRAYAIAAIDKYSQGQEDEATMKTLMVNSIATLFRDQNSNLLPITFIIDNKIGQAVAQVQYRDSIESTFNVVTEEQKVGDMVLSKYLKLEDRNYFSADGKVVSWTAAAPTTSYRVYSDVAGGLTNFNMEYKYLYL